jgi:spermidine synthase
MDSRSLRVAPLFFFSGFCALVYQMAWLREFRLIFGTSTAATAAVLAIFMGGLGFGGVILGPRSESKERPLEFYAQLELLIAAYTALTPIIILAMRQIYVTLGGTLAMGLGFGTVIRLLMSGLALGFPTFLMGGTLPAIARTVVRPEDTNRRPVGFLYGVNTLGAVAGAATATFYLFETWGNRTTLAFAALINIVVALAAFRISKTLPAIQEGLRKPTEAQAGSAPQLFVYAASAVAGFAFLLMEIVWYRMLSSLLGGSTFTFGLILAVALLGIVGGGLIYSAWFSGRDISLSSFASVSALEALGLAIPYALGDRIALLAMLLRPLGVFGFYGFVAGWVIICSIVVLPAAIISGIQFPMLIALLGKGRRQVGTQTGMTCAWNTVGAILGSLAGGFGLLPAFSAPGVWRAVVILLSALVMAAAIIELYRQWNIFRLIPSVATALIALCLLAATGPTAFWRHSEIGVGRLAKFSGSKSDFHDLMNGVRRDTLWETDGVESSIALSKTNNLNFIVNGKCDGGLKIDGGTQIMSGLIAAALHPQAARALVVGLGTGSTAGWLAAVPSIERVDVFELEPAILHVARQCTPMNHDALANPKLHVVIGDARELLLVTRDKYDLIVSEPSNPYRAGIANLFTREYYEGAARRLNRGGLFAQWVQAYEIDDRTIQTVYATFGSVFRNVETWQPQGGDLLLIGTDSPRSHDVGELRRRIAQEPFATALRNIWHVTNLEGFLAHFIADDSIAKRLQSLPGTRLNTDNRTVLEYAFARNVDLRNGFRVSSFRRMAGLSQSNRLSLSGEDVNWTEVNLARLSMLLSFGETPIPSDYADEVLSSKAAAYASFMNSDLTGALASWRKYPREPNDLDELLMVAECTADEGGSQADTYIEKLRDFLPLGADAIRAMLLWRRGQANEAANALEKVLQRLHEDPWLSNKLISRSLLLAQQIVDRGTTEESVMRLYETLRTPFLVYNGDALRLAALLRCGMKLDNGHYGKYCLPVVESLEPHVPWQSLFLQVRAMCYKATNNPRLVQSERDLRTFLSEQPSRLDAVLPARKPAADAEPGTASAAR